MTLIVGKKEAFESEWKKDATFITTGTATVAYTRAKVTDGTVEYLQSDASTWAAAVNTFAMMLTGNVWRHILTIPATAQGYTVTATMTHSDATLPDNPESHYVVASDEDAIYGRLGTISSQLNTNEPLGASVRG